MKYKNIVYQAVKNLGNYESHRLEISVELDDQDDPKESAYALMQQVNLILATPPIFGKPSEDPEDY